MHPTASERIGTNIEDEEINELGPTMKMVKDKDLEPALKIEKMIEYDLTMKTLKVKIIKTRVDDGLNYIQCSKDFVRMFFECL